MIFLFPKINLFMVFLFFVIISINATTSGGARGCFCSTKRRVRNVKALSLDFHTFSNKQRKFR